MKIECNIEKVIKQFINGEIICIQTDTLFALSCDATNSTSVHHLYEIKKRNHDKKLPVLFSHLDHVMEHCDLSNDAIKLAKAFWPGPLTIITKLKKNSNIAQNAFDTQNSFIAVRVPQNNNIMKIISRLKKPIIGTSANISNMANPMTYEEVEKQLGSFDITLLKVPELSISGMQSTIISFENSNMIILRSGSINENDLQKILS